MYTLILVDYNSPEATAAYIDRCRSALGQKGAGHIVIVENGDHDKALAQLQQLFGQPEAFRAEGIDRQLYRFTREDSQIVYCHSGGNLGYAQGNNIGAGIAQVLWADPYYIVSNNDLVFEGPFPLEKAEALFESDPAIGVIGPQVVTPEGVTQSPRRWISAYRRLFVFIWLCAISGFVSAERYQKLKDRHCEDLCPDAPTGPCGWVSGCFTLLRASAFHQIGMFDPNTFLYAEEPILSRRMERGGYRVWFCRELKIIHKHAQTTKKSISRRRLMELDFASMFYYYKTYTDTPKLLLLLARWNFALYKGFHRLWNAIRRRDEE